MSQFPNQYRAPAELDYGYSETSQGNVARFFHLVYLWVAIGLAVSAVVSAGIAFFAPQQFMISNMWIAGAAALGMFALAWTTGSVAMRIGMGAGLALFFTYATLTGVLIAPIWIAYDMSTIGAAFLLTGGLFAVMSLVGFVTKIDLTKIGMIAVMIVIGLFAASLINLMFARSDMLSWIITYAIVIIFPIIIAWKTQDLRNMALEHGHNGEMMGRLSVAGALTLYIAFINLFLAILRILGSRR